MYPAVPTFVGDVHRLDYIRLHAHVVWPYIERRHFLA